MRLAKKMILAAVAGVALLATAGCGSTYSEDEAILGDRVNPKLLPEGTGGSGPTSGEEVILGHDVNPKYLEDRGMEGAIQQRVEEPDRFDTPNSELPVERD